MAPHIANLPFFSPFIAIQYVLAAPLVLLAAYILQNEVVRYRQRVKNLSGPRGWPLVGSLFQLRGTVHAETYRQWAQRYGPVFQVQLGNTTVVLINTAKSARELFIGQAHAMNSRPQFYVFHKKVTQKAVLSIGTSPWDDSCKYRRKAAATALNRNRVESYGPILNLEAREFLKSLLEIAEGGERTVDFLPAVKRFTLNLSLTLNYGTRVSSLKLMTDDRLMQEIMYVEDEISNLRDTSKNYANYIPLLRYWQPVQQTLGWGKQKKGHAADIGKRRLEYNRVLQRRLEDEVRRDVDNACIQGSVLRDPEASGLTQDELISVSLSMMAGAHSNQATLTWAILLLAHRQDIQAKAYRVVHIDALTKELSRYFVVLKLALPKATYTDVIWEGATIPANTTVFLNAWACNRDPELFPDADTFAPERWLPTEDGGTTPHAHQYAFGMGGRGCVAQHLAHRALYTVFLHLITKFHILPPDATSAHVIDPLKDLRDPETFVAEPRDFTAKLVPREGEKLSMWLSSPDGN
ncbi:hypothetical protein LTR85_009862 [Meristemomyces frigidus]|nr:hypothetical protein LTR85_009862 [Meristemomyces frigidus]